MTSLLVALLLAADASAVVDRYAPTVNARLDKTEARIGDVLRLTIIAVGPRSTPVNLPRALELAPFAEIDDSRRREEKRDIGDGRIRHEFLVDVAAYEPGELTFPAIEVTYVGRAGAVLTARTQPIPVRIRSLLANEPEPQLKDYAAPVRVMQQDLLLAYIAGGLVLAAVGFVIGMVVRRRLRARSARRPAPPPRPPHEIALDKLDRLGAVGFTGDDLRPFTFELSEIVRQYLGARFAFDSLELTTEELIEELRRREARGLVLGEVHGWLASCDLVKFAKVSPSPTEARGALETAIRIVESTRPRPQADPGSTTAPPAEAARG